MAEPSAELVAALARSQLALIKDSTVRDALEQRLRSPQMHYRNWEYGIEGERYPCFTIVEAPHFDTAIVYSKHGHGIHHPWGLVSMADAWFGMDSGWFLRLEDAFVDSQMARDLEIWDIVSPSDQVVYSSLKLEDAFSRRDQLDASLSKPVHKVLYRSRLPEGVP